MAAIDVLGNVSDRLVGGMMFHSDHADLCRFIGVEWLVSQHEDGYQHDSKCLRKVHMSAIANLGVMVTDGRQERSHALDAYRKESSWTIAQDVACKALKDSMVDWIEWERGTATMMASAYRRLWDGGELSLANLVRKIAEDTEEELAHARLLMREMDNACWDMTYILSMK